MPRPSPSNTILCLKEWSLDHLPIIPSAWELRPREKVGKQTGAIRKLLRQTKEVVVATDPDRESEVITREVLDEVIYRGPVSRLLLSTLDPRGSGSWDERRPFCQLCHDSDPEWSFSATG